VWEGAYVNMSEGVNECVSKCVSRCVSEYVNVGMYMYGRGRMST
jgi:hypothetical protein